jgi:hypothetical protein
LGGASETIKSWKENLYKKDLFNRKNVKHRKKTITITITTYIGIQGLGNIPSHASDWRMMVV